MEYDNTPITNKNLQFPCAHDPHKLTTVIYCGECKDRMNCDIYATMLDEVADM